MRRTHPQHPVVDPNRTVTEGPGWDFSVRPDFMHGEVYRVILTSQTETHMAASDARWRPENQKLIPSWSQRRTTAIYPTAEAATAAWRVALLAEVEARLTAGPKVY